MVLGLLGVLAYGSFAFGKYVLSAKLFGEDGKSGGPRQVSRSTTEASAVTRQTGWKGDKPRVEVKVLPADQTGPSPDLPEFGEEKGFNPKSKSTGKTDTDQPTRTGTNSPSENDSSESSPPIKSGATRRNVDDGSAEYSLGGESGKRTTESSKRSEDSESRSRRRRRRNRSSPRKNNSTETNRPKTDSTPARSDAAPAGDGRDNNSSGGDDSSISVTTNNSRRPRQRVRERPRRDTSSSPVPRPENSSGGDSASISPVPQPE